MGNDTSGPFFPAEGKGAAQAHRNDGWEAAFSWAKTWELRPPDKVWLERIEGPQGQIECKDAAAYEAELRRLFPDAFTRVFNSCEREID